LKPTQDGDKYCPGCGLTKPLREFAWYTLAKDWHAYRCKECQSKMAKQRYRERREKLTVFLEELKKVEGRNG